MTFKQNPILLLAVLFLFTGCGPVISQAVIDEAQPDVLFGDLQRNTENYVGKSVLFGGTIVKVGNEPKGTWVEVLERPLGFRLEPMLDDQTGGRFLLVSDQILDEQIFTRGRKITVVGKVEGRETRPLDQITYDYPVLRIREYHLWPPGSRRGGGPDVFFSLGIFKSF